ncbi:MAG TPA: PAS domain S-box protein, partial [Tahibacter sp.]|nr:PAS domain S-box protein [Tahibacter sp.]
LVLVLDAADGCIVDANPAAERTLGWTRAELVGKRPVDLGFWLTPEARALVWARLRGERRIVNEPIRFARRDGSVLAATLQCELFESDDRVYVLAIGQEAHTSTAAPASAPDVQSYRSLFLAASEGIYRSLPEGGMIDVNPAMARIFGYDTPEQMLLEFPRVTRRLYVDGTHCDRIYTDLDTYGQITNERAQVYRRDGSTIWISENARTVRDARGHLLFFEGSMVDITDQVAAEACLRQSEALYRILVDNCRDGVFLIQRGKVVFTNGAMAAMLGYDVDELIGGDYMRLVAPESRDAQQERRVARESGSRETQGYEIVMLRKDGERRIVEVRADPVEFDGDIASTGTARDVTEERASRLALAEAERKYRKLFEHTVVGLFRSHPDGRILEANPAFARMLGYASPAELTASVAHAGDIYVDAGERARLMRRLEREGQFRDEEVRFRRRDGGELWVSADAHLVRGADGAVLHVEGSTQDVTARRDAEHALRRSEERYRLLVEHSQAAVYVMRDDRYTYVNQMFAALSGYAEHELVGMHWRQLATDEGMRIVEARLAARARGEAVPHDYETLLKRKDGRELRVNVSAGVFRLDDVDYFSGTLRDVTERHRFEQELEHNATHDALTQLPNRERFERLVAQRLERSRESGRHDYAVLFLDLDGFKLVNDSLGHAAGDRLLIAIAARLGAVHGRIRVAQHFLRRRIRVGAEHDADARAGVDAMTVDLERLGERGEHLPRDDLGRGRVARGRRQHGEFVAAVAREHAAVAEARREAFGDGDQQAVAGGMAEAVVDELEAVEIEKQHRVVEPSERLRALEPLRHQAVEQLAVRQLGQRIVRRGAFELAFEAVPLGHVAQRAAEVVDVVEAEHAGADVHAQLAPVLVPEPGFVVVRHRLAARSRGQAFLDDAQTFGRSELAPVHADEFVLLVAAQRHEHLIDVGVAVVAHD